MATYLGLLVQLCCGEGETLQRNTTWVCGSARSGWATLGLPQSKVACASRVYTAQAPSCSARALSQVGTLFHALPRSKPLRYWVFHKGTDLDGLCVLCPSQVWKFRWSVAWWVNCSRWAMHHINCLDQTTQFLRCTARAQSQVCHVSPMGSWSQSVTLLTDVNHPGFQEDVVSNWKPAHSSVENGLCGQDFSSPLSSGSGYPLPAFLPLGRESPIQQPACSPLVFVQSFVLWTYQGSPCGIRAFHGKGFIYFILFFVSLATSQFRLLSHISSLRLSSRYSGQILILRTNDVAHASLPSSH